MSSSVITGSPASTVRPAETGGPTANGKPLPPVLSRPGVGPAVHAALVEVGAEPDALLAELGLDPSLFDGGKLVPYATLGRLITLGAERTNCPHLGLLVGQRATLASLGPVSVPMRNSDNVGHALRALVVHSGKQNWGAVIGLGIDSGIAVLSHAPYGPEADCTAVHSERALATLTNVLRALCGADWAPEEVLLPRSKPRDATPYDQFFRAPVRFDQEAAALAFSAACLEQPIAGADRSVRRTAEERLRRLEAERSSNVTEELRRHIRIQMIRQRCNAKRVARMRLVTRRTLSRHLRAEGTTFRQLNNEALFGVAKQLLADTCMSLTEISVALNYSELAAFTHAFRRWSGMTPSAWRRENRPTDAIWPLKTNAELENTSSSRAKFLGMSLFGRQALPAGTIPRRCSRSPASVQT